MASRDSLLNVKIRGDSKGAEDALDRTGEKSSTLGGKFESLRGKSVIAWAAIAAAVAAAVTAIAKGIQDAIASSQKHEEAIARMEAALPSWATANDLVSKSLQAQASELEKTTRFGADATLAAQGLLLTLGVAPDNIGKATQATVDLAAAFGTTLEQAARNVGRTMGGTAGELSGIVPELAGMSKEALQAGAAIDIIAQKWGGTAVKQAATFGDSVTKLGNAYNNLKIAAGDAFTKNETLLGVFKTMSDLFNREDIATKVRNIADGFIALAGALVEATTALAGLIAKIPGLGALIKVLGFALNGFVALPEAIGALRAEQRALEESVKEEIRLRKLVTEKMREQHGQTLQNTQALGEDRNAVDDEVAGYREFEQIMGDYFATAQKATNATREQKQANEELAGSFNLVTDAASQAGSAVDGFPFAEDRPVGANPAYDPQDNGSDTNGGTIFGDGNFAGFGLTSTGLIAGDVPVARALIATELERLKSVHGANTRWKITVGVDTQGAYIRSRQRIG